MSGGVDSSAAAWLLKKQGYRVIGVTMQIWENEDSCAMEREGGCCGVSAVEDARRVAEKIGIPYYVLNFRAEFDENVIRYFIREYERGRTPNPCIACNRYVKWESLLRRSLEIGADYIATGHYARKLLLPNGRFAVRNSVTAEKDQTYALYNLTQFQLSRTLFPDGAYTKPEIRKIAADAGLPVASKPDSQDICFVPDGDYAGFIERRTGQAAAPGNFVDEAGNILGRHCGITHYTVGQRRGLGLPLGRRVFVKELRPDTNEVVLAENDALFTSSLTCSSLNWMAVPDLGDGEERRVTAKIRYSHRGAPAVIRRAGPDQVLCLFDEPVRAVTPGQAAVFYEDGHILGGGIID